MKHLTGFNFLNFGLWKVNSTEGRNPKFVSQVLRMTNLEIGSDSLISTMNKISKLKYLLTIKSKLFMNTVARVALGVLGGCAVIAALGGFSSSKGSENRTFDRNNNNIPDEILDGPVHRNTARANQVSEPDSEIICRNTERRVRNFQSSISRMSEISNTVLVIANSLVRLFCPDSHEERITTSTVIY